jgi:3-oxoacyl-(acyl-carrier-protein) synthase
MRKVVITGAGALTPLADTPAALHAALCEGRSALKSIELFALDGINATDGKGGGRPRLAGEIRPFEPRDHLGDRNLRPVDRTARLLLIAAQQALETSGWTAGLRAGREVGLVLGTMFCSVRTIAEFDRRAVQLGPSYASPLDFANSVINAAAGQAAIWHDLRGINTTITGGEASSLLALAYATDLLRDGRSEALVTGGAEELCFESYLGHDRAGRLGHRPVPFDAQRDGFALSEGAGALMLEGAEAAAARGARILATVRGHGETFDPAGGGDEGSAASAVARAVRLALEDAEVEPGDLDLLVLAANGGVHGDRAEARGVAAALGPRAGEIPVAAPKAQLGEALGASGAFQALAALGIFSDGVVPGVTGLEGVEEGFPLGGVSAQTRRLGRRPRLALLHAACTDGQCCAVVVEAG